jgi:hypothetical protein
MNILGIAGVTLGLLLMCGVSSAAEPLTQADKDWLRLQCDNKHASENCSAAGKQLREEGKHVSFDDLLEALPPLQEEKPWERYKAAPIVQEERQPANFEATVQWCIVVVRQETGGQYSKFDAYVEDSTVSYISTQEQQFKFRKCMSKNGHPLK